MTVFPKSVLAFFALPFCSLLAAQNISGVVTSQKSELPVEYVNIGIAGKNIGTVSDMSGKYKLDIGEEYANDTLLFSCIGYEPFAIAITDLIIAESQNITLKEASYNLTEVLVKPQEIKHKVLGVTIKKSMIASGFQNNSLGYECGLLMENKKTAFIKKVNFNISSCKHDSIFYRLNIYKVDENKNFENILQKPIYLNYSKADTENTISVDLQHLNLIVDGSFLVTLEHVKDLGRGGVWFPVAILRKSYARTTSQGEWNKIPAGLSISAEVDVW